MREIIDGFDLKSSLLDKQKVMVMLNRLLGEIPSITTNIFPFLKDNLFEYQGKWYKWLCATDTISQKDECKIQLSVSTYEDSVRVYRYTIIIEPETIRGEFNHFVELSPFYKSLATDYTKALSHLVHDNKEYLLSINNEIVKRMMWNAIMRTSYEVASKYVKSTIKLHDFIALYEDDLNYNKKIYRITDEMFIPIIEDKLKKQWMFGKEHRFENVKLNRMFYIENMDIQDITETNGDTLYSLVTCDDPYEVIDIIE